ncbi:MAG TPA: IS701 family transposase [Candidatus Competibacter sp.]|nr:IS701 family transposase [Candidatus Competibacter sp.]
MAQNETWAAGWREEEADLAADWAGWTARLGRHAKRLETRDWLAGYLRGLLGGAERRNCWQLAEAGGVARPDGFQHLLSRARWDVDGVRDAVRAQVVATLSDDEAVLIVDETGFLKKGRHSAGVKRQYSGTAGRIENRQVGVFLAYASCWGQGLIDRALFLPEEWSSDRARCREAGIDDTVAHQPKTELARAMLLRALEAGVTARWVTGDAVYGESGRLRTSLEERGQGYVFAVTGKTYVCQGLAQRAVRDLVAAIAADGRTPWARLSAGAGSQGPRESDWTAQPINTPPDLTGQRYLLVRRREEGPLTAYVAFAPQPVSLADLVLAAGARWAIERCFQETQSQLGLDQYEVRTWHGWHRHSTLVMAAYAFLVARRQRLLKKNLHSLQSDQPLPSFPWPTCDAGFNSPPSREARSAVGERSSGSAGVTAISASLSTTTGGGDNTKITAPSRSH